MCEIKIHKMTRFRIMTIEVKIKVEIRRDFVIRNYNKRLNINDKKALVIYI